MDPNQAKVIEQVDEKAIVDLASELIKIPSFKLEETPVATFLADFFGSRGYMWTSRKWSRGGSKRSPRWRGPAGDPA